MARSKAVIWDMDGVIADTAPYHFQAWREVFRKRSVDFTEADFKRNFGQRNDTIIGNTLGERIAESEIGAIAAEKEEIFRKVVKQNVRPYPGAVELIKSLSENGFKVALASSAPIENIRLVTQSLGIDGYFHSIVTGRDVAEGKPSPQGFLLAAQKLGVEPKDCIVIEDAIAGVAACKGGGMQCIAVTNTHPKERLADADLIVAYLEEVKIDELEKLIYLE